MLMELAAWREQEAQSRDVPRSRALKDDILVDIALAAPRTPEALAGLRSFPRGMERSRAGVDRRGHRARLRARSQDPSQIDRERRGNGGGATVVLLKVLLKQVCDLHGVAPKMVATVDDLEAIATHDKPPFLL